MLARQGMAMNRATWTIIASACTLAGHSPAAAATIIILSDPFTLDRRLVVMNTPGPDRVLMCSAPPAMAGCRALPVRRKR